MFVIYVNVRVCVHVCVSVCVCVCVCECAKVRVHGCERKNERK